MRVLLGTLFGLLGVLGLVVATSFFVAIEFALLAVDRTRIEQKVERGDAGARLILGLLGRLSFSLSSAQLGISIMAIVLGFVSKPTIGAIIEPTLEPLLGSTASGGVSVVLAVVVGTVFVMVIGELVPKTVAISKPERTARLLSRPMMVWNYVMYPVIWVFDGAANRVVRWLGVEPREEIEHKPSIDELEALIISSGEDGALDPEEVELLTRSIRFSEKTAADALIPRVNVTALNSDASVADLVERSLETGFSRFPVIGRDLDDCLGLVHVKSVYRLPAKERASCPVTDLMTPVHAVPETRELEGLFADLRADRDHMAVVVDEHGGTAGIITLEDLLEEIVGEIDDEYDVESPRLSRVEEPGNFIVSAALHPDEVADACEFRIPDGPYETLAGFVLMQLGHIPVPGELFDYDGWRVEVMAVDRLRITTVRLAAPWAR